MLLLEHARRESVDKDYMHARSLDWEGATFSHASYSKTACMHALWTGKEQPFPMHHTRVAIMYSSVSKYKMF
jgi:hypothetical protein